MDIDKIKKVGIKIIKFFICLKVWGFITPFILGFTAISMITCVMGVSNAQPDSKYTFEETTIEINNSMIELREKNTVFQNIPILYGLVIFFIRLGHITGYTLISIIPTPYVWDIISFVSLGLILIPFITGYIMYKIYRNWI